VLLQQRWQRCGRTVCSRGSGLEPEPWELFAPPAFGYLIRKLVTLTGWKHEEKLLHKVFRAPGWASHRATSLPGYGESSGTCPPGYLS